MSKVKPAKIKIKILYLEIIIIQGNTDVKLTIVAPIPIETSSAGRAQQISVLTLVSKLKNGETKFL